MVLPLAQLDRKTKVRELRGQPPPQGPRAAQQHVPAPRADAGHTRGAEASEGRKGTSLGPLHSLFDPRGVGR